MRITGAERIRALEVHVEQMLEDGLRREEKQVEILTEVRNMRLSHEALSAEINKYKGFLGGILWVFVAMSTAIYHLVGPLYNWIVGLKTGK